MFSEDLQSIFRDAVSEVHRRHHELLTVEHVLFAVMRNPKGRTILEDVGAKIPALATRLEEFFARELEVVDAATATDDVIQSLLVQRVLKRSVDQVHFVGKKILDVGDLLVSIMDENCYATYYLRLQGIEQGDLIEYLEDLENEQSAARDEEGESQASGRRSPLAQYTVDLIARAREGKIDPLIGRDTELDRTLEVLCRRRKNNPLYVGEPGVGKTAMVEGLALRIVEGKVPPMFANTRIFALDMGLLLAGTKYRGDFESRLKGVVAAIKKIPEAILFIDELHTLVGAGAVSGGSMDAANMLKPALASGEIRCIGSTTYEEFRNRLEKDRALARRFQKIDLHEPSAEDCVTILKGVQAKYADFHKVSYPVSVLKAIVDLSTRHVKDRLLPDKAIDVLDEVGAQIRIRQSQANAKQEKPEAGPVTVRVRDVEQIVARMAGVPVQSVSGQEEQRLGSLAKEMKALVFGQDEAIDTVVRAILRSRAGLSCEGRPSGSFLFYGPTGVGKTEIARSLATCLSVDFLRFDMSEYMEKHSVSRLVGTPPGYVGFDQGGLLTEAVRKAPYSVVLLDELEKAHPDIFNILLQVMDYGTLTDNTGRKTNFANVILIMTSNAGAFEMNKRSLGFAQGAFEDAAQKALTAVEKLFSPEFRNRLDALVPFHSLSQEMMLNIVQKFLSELTKNLRARNVELTVTDAAREWLATKGYDPSMGARPLRRLIREQLEDVLAEAMLFGDLKKGGRAIFDVAGEGLSLATYAQETAKKGKKKAQETQEPQEESEKPA